MNEVNLVRMLPMSWQSGRSSQWPCEGRGRAFSALPSTKRQAFSISAFSALMAAASSSLSRSAAATLAALLTSSVPSSRQRLVSRRSLSARRPPSAQQARSPQGGLWCTAPACVSNVVLTGRVKGDLCQCLHAGRQAPQQARSSHGGLL